MERINWHEEPVAENKTQQPLGRILVPVGESAEEPPKKKRRRQNGTDNRERRRLIIHVAILVVLLGLICYGIFDFLYEGPRQGVPQPKSSVHVDSASVSEN